MGPISEGTGSGGTSPSSGVPAEGQARATGMLTRADSILARLKPRSEFAGHVLTVMTGTTIAQAIPVAVSPILSRIYSPDDFGVFSLYSAVAAAISILATGRYELAVMLPREEDEAANLVVLSLAVSFLLFLLSGAALWLAGPWIIALTGNSSIGAFLYWLPLTLLLSGIYQGLNYWCNRNKDYKAISTRKVIQSSVSASVQVSAGGMPLAMGGLVAGSMAGQVMGVATMARMSWPSLKSFTGSITRRRVCESASKYKNFPMLSCLGGFANSSASYAPVYLMTGFYGLAATGLFGMANKVINMPLSLISGAVSEVMFQRVSHAHNTDAGSLTRITMKTFLCLLAIVSPMVVVLGLFGPQIFSLVFGKNWAEAGGYAAILSLSVAVKFAVSPLSSVLILEHNVRKGVLWQGAYFAGIFPVLYLASRLETKKFLMVYVIYDVLMYALYLLVILKATMYRPAAKDGGASA